MAKETNLVSMSGAPIFRYTDGEKEWESAFGEENIEEISNHIESHIGAIDTVFHEVTSVTVHIDIHHVRPTTERPFHTLITSGMSDLPMKVPQNTHSTHFMELMITLPEYWKIDTQSFKEEEWYWPIRQLKNLARFPHSYKTWLGFGHTLRNENPAESYASNTLLNSMIILPSVNVPNDFHKLKINENKIIEFFSIVPLYNEEMNLKLRKGSDALLERFDKYGINDIVSINRKNTGKKLFRFL